MNKPLLTNITQFKKTDIGIRDYIAIILRRKTVIIVSLLSLVLSTIYYVYRIEDIYESFSILVIEESNPVMSQVMKVGGRPLSFYQGILNSRTYLELTLDSIGMDVFKTSFPKFTKKDAIQYTKNNISLRKTSYASFLRLNCRAKSRELAYFIASVATNLFQRRCQEVESEESRRAVIEIDKQLKIIREKLEKAEYDYRTFKDKTGNILEGMPPELKTLQEVHAENLALLGIKEADLKAEKAQLIKLERIVTPAATKKSPEVLKLKSRLRELEKAEEQRILSASSSAGIKIVDIAQMPDNPIPKNETRYYILGVILGLVLGFGLAFILEFNDTPIKSNDDIEKYLNVPVLGTIPHITFSKKEDIKIKRRSSKSRKSISVTHYPSHLLNFSGDESVTAEAYRSLRTNLSFVSPDNPIKCLLITSAGPTEGKSLTIANLALSYAQMGKKTLLVDTDLRRPVLHHIFGMKREPGFTDLFATNSDYDTVIKSTQRENIYIITAGIFTPNPAELIASQKMAAHIDYFRNNFDMVFFDTPPIVAVTDATLLGTKLDGILLVVRSHKTTREIAMQAVSNLNNVGVKCIGSVLNDINLSHRYSSYGYYKYYYHYYKSKV